jgi:hypothetical protein
MPTPNQVHVNAPLTNMSLEVLQSETAFAAADVFPPCPVAKQSDLYFEYSREDFLRANAKVRAPNTESAGADYGVVANNPYFCRIISIHKDISEEERTNSDEPLKPDQDAMRFVTRQILVGRELLFGTAAFTTGVWTTQFEGVAGGPVAGQFRQWSDYTNSDPLLDAENFYIAMEDLTGFRPNVMLVGRDVHSALINHPDIIERVKYTSAEPIREQILAKYFGVEKYKVARSIYNTSAVPGTPAYSQLLTAKSMLFAYAAPAPSVATASAGYMFVWKALPGVNEKGLRIMKEPVPNKKADRIEGEMALDFKVVCADLGIYCYTAVA